MYLNDTAINLFNRQQDCLLMDVAHSLCLDHQSGTVCIRPSHWIVSGYFWRHAFLFIINFIATYCSTLGTFSDFMLAMTFDSYLSWLFTVNKLLTCWLVCEQDERHRPSLPQSDIPAAVPAWFYWLMPALVTKTCSADSWQQQEISVLQSAAHLWHRQRSHNDHCKMISINHCEVIPQIT